MKFCVVVVIASANLIAAAIPGVVTSYKVIEDSDSDAYKKSIPPPIAAPDEKENHMDYWKNQAATLLKNKIDNTINTNKAKNIIFFLGDGMSVTTVTAARIYKGQLKNKPGEEERLKMETFPYTGLSKVIMGGGLSKFLPTNGSKHGRGNRLEHDLVEEWLKDKAARNVQATFVTNVTQLKQVDETKTDYLLGLFSPEHMSYHLQNRTNEPTLEYMTEKAINILKKNPNGFFLFVEGGKIDMAHHRDEAHMALDETVEFDKAIEKAYSMTNEKDTLIVVTADHSHTMTMNGYPIRGNNILGLFGKSNDSLPYATLSYANGPGYHEEKSGKRHNLDEDNMSAHDYMYPAMVPKEYETHGGDDVAVFASGPWSHLFSGAYEQNFIPIAEAYAAKIGPSSPSSSIIFKASFSVLLFGIWLTRMVGL